METISPKSSHLTSAREGNLNPKGPICSLVNGGELLCLVEPSRQRRHYRYVRNLLKQFQFLQPRKKRTRHPGYFSPNQVFKHLTDIVAVLLKEVDI